MLAMPRIWVHSASDLLESWTRITAATSGIGGPSERPSLLGEVQAVRALEEEETRLLEGLSQSGDPRLLPAIDPSPWEDPEVPQEPELRVSVEEGDFDARGRLGSTSEDYGGGGAELDHGPPSGGGRILPGG